MLDASLSVAAQIGEIGPEGSDPERAHALGDSPLDIIALGLAEQHAGASVEELADRAEFLLRYRPDFTHRWSRAGAAMRSVATLRLKVMKGSPAKRVPQRTREGT